jgi:hypothetical protein
MPSGNEYPFGTVEATTTATFLMTNYPDNSGVLVKNQGPATVYLGGSSVTADQSATGGLPLEPGETQTVPGIAGSGDPLDLYVICAEEGAQVTWLAAS